MIPVLIGISFIAFLLLQLTPGDPVKIILGPKAGPEAVNAVKQKYGLDRPIPLQYIIYVKITNHFVKAIF